MFHTKNKVLSASDDVAFHMDKILKNFVSGSKICVVVLTPNNVDGSQDFLMTDAALDDVIDAVERRKQRGNEHPR